MGTVGPCKDGNSLCYAYLEGTTSCPAGTQACVTGVDQNNQCVGCVGGTAGECRTSTFVCYPEFLLFGNPACVAGTIRCVNNAAPVPSPELRTGGDGANGDNGDSECGECLTGTSGPCQAPNTVCYDYESGQTCPAGTRD